MIVECNVSEQVIKKAKKKALEMGTLNNSITSGGGNLAGFIGEEIVREYIQAKESNTYDYDLIKSNIKIDVKTKRTNFPPLPHYEASIANYNPNQKCDVYVFVRVMNDFTKAYICGWISKEGYFKKAKFLRQGDYDPSNNWHCKADCYNVPYSDLNCIKSRV